MQPRSDTPTGAPGGPTREDIEERIEQIDSMTHFDVLGVQLGATKEEIQSSYFKLAKSWHPDRLPGDVQDLRNSVSKIFAKISEAYQTLSNDDKRQRYELGLSAGMGTVKDRQAIEKVVDSALIFQKGEVLFKKGQYASAEDFIQKAVDADPEQPEYMALLAWVQALRIGNPPPLRDGEHTDHYRKQIAILDRVIAVDGAFERACFYRAELLKRSGLYDKAMKDYRKCVGMNPRNIDAAREVRLYEKRRKKKGGGLFGLFKKSDD